MGHKFGSIASDLLSSAYYVVVSTSPARTFASRKRNIASPSHVSAMGGFEGLCASVLCDRSDPTRLTGKEIKDEFGSLENFVRSYGLTPYDMEDLKVALVISRQLKESRERAKRHGYYQGVSISDFNN